jgi:hypothetical protein
MLHRIHKGTFEHAVGLFPGMETQAIATFLQPQNNSEGVRLYLRLVENPIESKEEYILSYIHPTYIFSFIYFNPVSRSLIFLLKHRINLSLLKIQLTTV